MEKPRNTFIQKSHNNNINGYSNKRQKKRRCPSRIFFEGIEEQCINQERQNRTKIIIQSEQNRRVTNRNKLSRLNKFRKNKTNSIPISRNQNSSKIYKRQKMNHKVRSVDCSNTKSSLPKISSVDKQLTSIQLQNDHNEKKDKNNTSINQREYKNRHELEKVFRFESICQSQNQIKSSLDYIIPISVSVRVDDAIIHEQCNKNQTINSDNHKSKLCKDIQRPTRSDFSILANKSSIRSSKVTVVNKTAFVDISVPKDIISRNDKLFNEVLFVHNNNDNDNNNNSKRNQRGRFARKSKLTRKKNNKKNNTVQNNDKKKIVLNSEEKKIIQSSSKPIILEKCIFQDCTQRHIVVKGNTSYRNQYISKHNITMHSDCAVKKPNSRLNKLSISSDKICSYCKKPFYTQLSKREHEETRCLHNSNRFNRLQWNISLQQTQKEETSALNENKKDNSSIILRLQASKTSFYF